MHEQVTVMTSPTAGVPGLIREIHVASRGTYGYRRIHAELTRGRGIAAIQTLGANGWDGFVVAWVRQSGAQHPDVRNQWRSQTYFTDSAQERV